MSTKTLKVDYRECKATYRGKFVLDFSIHATIADIEGLAEDLGYTHIRWIGLPIGGGNTRSKLFA